MQKTKCIIYNVQNVHDWILLSTVNILIIQVNGFSLQIFRPGAIFFLLEMFVISRDNYTITVQTGSR